MFPQAVIINIRSDSEVFPGPVQERINILRTNRPSRMGNPRPVFKVDIVKRNATTGPGVRGSANNPVSHEILRRNAISACVLNVVKSLISERLFCSSGFDDQHLDFRSSKFLCDRDPSRSAADDAQIGFDRTGILRLFLINELHGKGRSLKCGSAEERERFLEEKRFRYVARGAFRSSRETWLMFDINHSRNCFAWRRRRTTAVANR